MKADIILHKNDVFVVKIVKDNEEKFLKIRTADFDGELDVDRMCRIDINNLVSEIIIAPVLLNRWGNIIAFVKAEYNKSKHKHEVLCARVKEQIRADFVAKGRKPTVDMVDDQLTLDPTYDTSKLNLIECDKAVELAESVYWALKTKNEQLNKLSLTIQKDDVASVKDIVLHGISVLVKNNKRPTVVEEED